jgi:hypothetical protein
LPPVHVEREELDGRNLFQECLKPVQTLDGLSYLVNVVYYNLNTEKFPIPADLKSTFEIFDQVYSREEWLKAIKRHLGSDPEVGSAVSQALFNLNLIVRGGRLKEKIDEASRTLISPTSGVKTKIDIIEKVIDDAGGAGLPGQLRDKVVKILDTLEDIRLPRGNRA